MKLRFNSTVLAVTMSLSSILGARDVCAVITYDLKTDWSDVSNPNGVWSYREGTNLLPHVAAWEEPAFGTNVQPAWAYSGFTSSHEAIPAWFKSAFNTPGFDWQTGDVVTHTTDPVNGVGNSAGDVTWTSPLNGTVDISGAVWMGRDVFRSNHWTLSLNGVPLTGGDISSGDPFNRASPFNFAAGSGGASVLNDVPVTIGDVITLQIARTSAQGDYVGVNFSVEAVPEPSSLALCAIATAVLGIGLCRKNSRSAVS